jgi:hypothetical protein
MKGRELERFVFLVLVALVFAWAGWQAASFPPRARIFPQTVAWAALLLALIEISKSMIVRMRRGAGKTIAQGETEDTGRAALREQLVAGAPYLLWIVAYYVGIYLLGFFVASGVFVLLFLNRVGQVRWPVAVVATAPLLAALFLLGSAMNLSWPGGLLSGALGLLVR